MRQYKFRGKRIDNGEWVTGWFYFFEGAYIRHCHETCHFDEGPQNSFTDFEVIPETVGQFTGLKDSKGIDIYEGQIVNDRIQGCVVQWDTREAKFNLSIIYNDEAFDIRQTHKPMPLDAMGITIIGDLCDKV